MKTITNQTLRIVIASFAFVLVVMFGACTMPTAEAGATLSVALRADPALASAPAAKGARAIIPGTGVAVLRWSITGTGPEGRVFSETGLLGTDHEFPGLSPGTWAFTARGYDAVGESGVLIAQSEATSVTLAAGVNEPLALNCAPIGGNGTFKLSVSLSDGIGVSPALSASLTPLGVQNPAEVDLVPTLDATSKAWTSSKDIGAGWYLLRVRATDTQANGSNALIWSHVDTVRILNDRTSSFTRSVAAGDANQPDNATLKTELQSGLNGGIMVKITGQESGVSTAGGTALSAAPDGTVSGTLAWLWYLDGTLVADATAVTWTVPAGLQAGTRHWVTAVAWRAAGDALLETAGSVTISFVVSAPA